MKKISSAITAAAIAGVIGMGGIALTGNVNAAPASTKTTTTTPSTNSSKSGSSSNSNSNSNTGSTSTIPETSAGTTTPTTTAAATTPDTGLFTADGEFASTPGAIALMGVLAVAGASLVIIRNRKELFRGRVDFDK